jgi:hypothetical protein
MPFRKRWLRQGREGGGWSSDLMEQMITEVLIVPAECVDKLLNSTTDTGGGLVHVVNIHILR